MGKLTTTALSALLLAGCDGPLDNTDNTSTGQRSGFVVKVDYGTGCEYLFASGIGGPLVPRISNDGKTVRGCRAKPPGVDNER